MLKVWLEILFSKLSLDEALGVHKVVRIIIKRETPACKGMESRLSHAFRMILGFGDKCLLAPPVPTHRR